MEGEDPGFERARQNPYRLDPQLSLQELKRLVSDAASGTQVPGMWALSELALPKHRSSGALVYSPSKDIEQGRFAVCYSSSRKKICLQKFSKNSIGFWRDPYRTGWVF